MVLEVESEPGPTSGPGKGTGLSESLALFLGASSRFSGRGSIFGSGISIYLSISFVLVSGCYVLKARILSKFSQVRLTFQFVQQLGRGITKRVQRQIA